MGLNIRPGNPDVRCELLVCRGCGRMDWFVPNPELLLEDPDFAATVIESKSWVMDISGFSDPWEHVRLLSDADRNEALLALLHRYAPGKRVLEVGCGTGHCPVLPRNLVLGRSLRSSHAVGLARELAHMNGLHQVTVPEDRIEALAPRPVDFAFSELLQHGPLF